MQAIARNCQSGAIDATVAVVVSNEPDASGIEKADALGIPAVVVDHRGYGSREEHERAILAAIEPYETSLAVLAGYMRIVTPVLLDRFHDAARGLPGVINIHPADTAAYQGTHGYEFAMGLTPGAARLVETKVTVHFVDSGMDTGPVIRQRTVPILPDDSLDDLKKRGLAQEYELYSEVIQLLAEDRVRVKDGRVVVDEKERA